jgi:cyclopropane fatty-acyl-phospholipid synthase-like methyltransferase
MLDKVTSQPCLRNQTAIFEALEPWLQNSGKLLELACGTGQHGVYMTARLPHLNWQLSEHPSQVLLSQPWYEEAQHPNLQSCIALDISQTHWPIETTEYEYAYCANLLHFVGIDDVVHIFNQVAGALKTKGLFFCYGPINENGFTSEGNRNLDDWLKQDINPKAGIKELTTLQASARQSGLTFRIRLDCPANNVILVFEKL